LSLEHDSWISVSNESNVIWSQVPALSDVQKLKFMCTTAYFFADYGCMKEELINSISDMEGN